MIKLMFGMKNNAVYFYDESGVLDPQTVLEKLIDEHIQIKREDKLIDTRTENGKTSYFHDRMYFIEME